MSELWKLNIEDYNLNELNRDGNGNGNENAYHIRSYKLAGAFGSKLRGR